MTPKEANAVVRGINNVCEWGYLLAATYMLYRLFGGDKILG